MVGNNQVAKMTGLRVAFVTLATAEKDIPFAAACFLLSSLTSCPDSLQSPSDLVMQHIAHSSGEGTLFVC